jgi:hypothetical protein
MIRNPSVYSPNKLKTNKREIGIVGFFFDLFSTSLFATPILPVPIRIDKLTNGYPTCIIFPNLVSLNEISQKIGFRINFENFFRTGLKNFIAYSREKHKSITYRPLSKEIVLKWYERSLSTTIEIPSLEIDFTFVLSEFLKTYSIITNSGMDFDDRRYNIELCQYCETVINYFRSRLESNAIQIKFNQEIREERIYSEDKKKKYYPQPIYTDVIYRKEGKPKKKLFIPYLIYDDLLDVFFYNLKMLKNGVKVPINVQIYKKNNIIIKGYTTSFNQQEKLIEKLYKFTYTD